MLLSTFTVQFFLFFLNFLLAFLNQAANDLRATMSWFCCGCASAADEIYRDDSTKRRAAIDMHQRRLSRVAQQTSINDVEPLTIPAPAPKNTSVLLLRQKEAVARTLPPLLHCRRSLPDSLDLFHHEARVALVRERRASLEFGATAAALPLTKKLVSYHNRRASM
jgi:hypothetical protein